MKPRTDFGKFKYAIIAAVIGLAIGWAFASWLGVPAAVKFAVEHWPWG